MKQIKFSVNDMSCNHCKMAIEKALDTLDGIKKVDINLDDKQVSIDYDESMIDEKKISDSIESAGYSTTAL